MCNCILCTWRCILLFVEIYCIGIEFCLQWTLGILQSLMKSFNCCYISLSKHINMTKNFPSHSQSYDFWYMRDWPKKKFYEPSKQDTFRPMLVISQPEIFEMYHFPVLLKCLNNAYTMFGPNLLGFMGKIVRQSPIRVEEDYVAIPWDIIKPHRFIRLTADVMFANELAICDNL